MHSTFEHGYALLVGVGTTAEPVWSLPVTVQDAKALERLLTDPSSCAYPPDHAHVRLLHDGGATRAAILKELRWLAAQAQADPDATVVVFYSGHGGFDAASGTYFLIPYDTMRGDVANTALSAHVLTEALRRVRARRLLVALDCCHAAGMAVAKELPANYVLAAPSKSVIDQLTQGDGRVVFSSSLGTQSSYVRLDGRLSVFTYHLLEALQGAGNLPGDTEARISNLIYHVGKMVPASVQADYHADQTPYFDSATTDFTVALIKGGKGLPAGGWADVRREAGERIDRCAPTVSVHAEGDRSVAIGTVTDSLIATGEHNILGSQNTVQRAADHHVAQSTGGNATVDDHSSHTVFDQRGQHVGSQINIVPAKDT